MNASERRLGADVVQRDAPAQLADPLDRVSSSAGRVANARSVISSTTRRSLGAAAAMASRCVQRRGLRGTRARR